MSSPLRIPPGVDFSFEKRVNAVLESAKPDYDRLPDLRTELMEHLRQRWREGIEKNLSTEAAEEQALELFGDPEAIGKSLRESWWRRLLFYKRCSFGRYLWIMAGQLFYCFLQATFFSLAEEVTTSIFKNNAEIYYWGVAMFTPLVAIGFVRFLSWKWRPKHRFTQILWFLPRGLAWAYFILFLNNMLYCPFAFTKIIVLDFLHGWESLWMLAHGSIGVLCGFMGTLCAISEIFHWPDKRSKSKIRSLH